LSSAWLCVAEASRQRLRCLRDLGRLGLHQVHLFQGGGKVGRVALKTLGPGRFYAPAALSARCHSRSRQIRVSGVLMSRQKSRSPLATSTVASRRHHRLLNSSWACLLATRRIGRGDIDLAWSGAHLKSRSSLSRHTWPSFERSHVADQHLAQNPGFLARRWCCPPSHRHPSWRPDTGRPSNNPIRSFTAPAKTRDAAATISNLRVQVFQRETGPRRFVSGCLCRELSGKVPPFCLNHAADQEKILLDRRDAHGAAGIALCSYRFLSAAN